MPLNKETAVMLVSQTNPQGIEFYSQANLIPVLFPLKDMAADQVSYEDELYCKYCFALSFTFLA